MKVYFGLRCEAGCKVFTWDTLSPQRPLPLAMANHLYDHSPAGPEWGYDGSGPAQLALALLYNATHDATFALDLHQPVKRVLVAGLPRDIWSRTVIDVLACALDVAGEHGQYSYAVHYLEQAQRAAKKGR